MVLSWPKKFFLLSTAYFTDMLPIKCQKKRIREKIVRQMKLCGKVKFMMYVSSNDAATA